MSSEGLRGVSGTATGQRMVRCGTWHPRRAALGTGPEGAHTQRLPGKHEVCLDLSRISEVDFPGQGNSRNTSPNQESGGHQTERRRSWSTRNISWRKEVPP